MLQDVLKHLEALVSFDTRNPPRAIGTGGIFDYLRAQLPGFEVRVTDHGAGAVSMLAVRGNPRRVFNVHMDTVPDSPAWTANPHVLRVTGDRAIGLGACDIKGAAAGLLAAASATRGDAAFLFSTDEEANDPRCIAAFLAREHGFTDAIIAEPTQCEAVLAHRGISSVLLRFRGAAGHASGANAMQASALHQAMHVLHVGFESARRRHVFGAQALAAQPPIATAVVTAPHAARGHCHPQAARVARIDADRMQARIVVATAVPFMALGAVPQRAHQLPHLQCGAKQR